MTLLLARQSSGPLPANFANIDGTYLNRKAVPPKRPTRVACPEADTNRNRRVALPALRAADSRHPVLLRAGRRDHWPAQGCHAASLRAPHSQTFPAITTAPIRCVSAPGCPRYGPTVQGDEHLVIRLELVSLHRSHPTSARRQIVTWGYARANDRKIATPFNSQGLIIVTKPSLKQARLGNGPEP